MEIKRSQTKGKGIKAAEAGSAKGKVQFLGKRTKVNTDDAQDENGAAGPAPTGKGESAPKPRKTQGGQGTRSPANTFLCFVSLEV